MPWFQYKLGHWVIAVDAINQRDAARFIRQAAPGASYEGRMFPPPASSKEWSNATAMITGRRQQQVTEYFDRRGEETHG